VSLAKRLSFSGERGRGASFRVRPSVGVHRRPRSEGRSRRLDHERCGRRALPTVAQVTRPERR